MQQQRQLRLGDILDDYCPRERRVTNHVVVAMVEQDVKQTRCTTCDAEHEYKHARVPRQRRKGEEQAVLYSQVLAGGPKRVAHEPPHDTGGKEAVAPSNGGNPAPPEAVAASAAGGEPPPGDQTREPDVEDEDEVNGNVEEGPAHRRLIRATLPRVEGAPPPTRPAPEFTIRQPTSRPGRFRPRHQQQQQRGASPFQGNRSGGNMGGGMRQGGGGNRPPMSRPGGNRHGHGGQGRKRSK